MKSILQFENGTQASEVPQYLLDTHETRCMETIEIGFGGQVSFTHHIQGKEMEVWAEDFRNKYEEVNNVQFPRNIKFGE